MRLIDADAQHDYVMEVYGGSEFIDFIDAMPTVDAVPVVRCKDCKHRPIKPKYYENGFDLEFPDDVCPCKCDDG